MTAVSGLVSAVPVGTTLPDQPSRLAPRTKGGALTKETAFYGKLAAVTDQWMDLFGYLAPSVVSTRTAEPNGKSTTGSTVAA